MDTTVTIREPATRDSPTRTPQQGMTLVELLVAMVIGLGVTLAVATMLVAGENHKRTTTSTNDADQTGNYVVYALDRAIRGAGSAIAQSAYPSDVAVLGCKISAGQILPRTTPFPPPFANSFLTGSTNNLRIAPVLIGAAKSDDGVSDVIMVIGGSGAAGGVSRPNNGTGSNNSMVLLSTVGFNVNDLALVSEAGQGGTPDCLLEQVSAATPPTSTTLTFAGTYYTQTGSSTNLTNMTADTTYTYITPLGNTIANNVTFELFGVGSNHALSTYDLLQNQNKVQGFGSDVSQPLADGVIQMNAIYGVATTTAPTVIANWAGPKDAGYDINSVMTNAATMKTIIAVRVALVVRGEYYDKNAVSPTSLTIFSGYTNLAGTPLSKNVTPLDPHYRYRVFEFTVPLRNMLLLAGA
jgi:type IV pilus assembly protein PilW